jgi:hypothetical protein
MPARYKVGTRSCEATTSDTRCEARPASGRRCDGFLGDPL